MNKVDLELARDLRRRKKIVVADRRWSIAGRYLRTVCK